MIQSLLSYNDLAFAHQGPEGTCVFKQEAEDFVVEELLDIEFTEQGEHLYLYIEKRELNTQDVLQRLQRYFSLPETAIGISGRKDKQSIARQWISLQLKKKLPVKANEFDKLGFRVLAMHWHSSKLRHGSHSANVFTITLRNVKADKQTLNAKLNVIKQQGVPNYFGFQRFGSAGDNVAKAVSWLQGEFRPRRYQQGLYLSALRSALFNDLLSKRIGQFGLSLLEGDQCIQRPVEGEFISIALNEQAQEQFIQGLLEPTLMLVGAGELSGDGWQHQLELQQLVEQQQMITLLKPHRLQLNRRAMRILPQDFSWHWGDGAMLKLRFKLLVGCYATSLLRELISFELIES